MAASNSAAELQQQKELHITRILNAPPAVVYQCFIDPKRIPHWWGPQGFSVPACRIEPRVGGVFHCDMLSPENTLHRVRGIYQEIVDNERLVFTWAWEDDDGNLGHVTMVTLTFEAQGGKTKLTLHQAVFESVESCNDHRDGWTQSFERLGAYVQEV